MYDLPYHKEQDRKIVREFIGKYPFAFLTGCTLAGRPMATQLPLFIENKGEQRILRGHIMKGTDHHKAFLDNDQVLAVFTGKHTYVSGTWYGNPNTPSTWNYMSVHVHGRVRFVPESELEEILQLTSLYFEEGNQDSPTVFNNLPLRYRQKTLEYIVGFEIEISDIDTVFKLSQDRDLESYQNIIERLQSQNEDGRVIAHEMDIRMKGLFPDHKR